MFGRTKAVSSDPYGRRRSSRRLPGWFWLTRDVTDSRTSIEGLQGDLAALVEALPAGPRDAVVEVRAARLSAPDGRLDSDLVLVRNGGAAKVLAGVLKLLITGGSAQHAGASAALKPIALSMGSHQIQRGSRLLLESFAPRQVTVQVLDKSDGQVLGVRALRVQ